MMPPPIVRIIPPSPVIGSPILSPPTAIRYTAYRDLPLLDYFAEDKDEDEALFFFTADDLGEASSISQYEEIEEAEREDGILQPLNELLTPSLDLEVRKLPRTLLDLSDELRARILEYVLPAKGEIASKCYARGHLQGPLELLSLPSPSRSRANESSASNLLNSDLLSKLDLSFSQDHNHLNVMLTCRTLYEDAMLILYNRTFEAEVSCKGVFFVGCFVESEGVAAVESNEIEGLGMYSGKVEDEDVEREVQGAKREGGIEESGNIETEVDSRGSNGDSTKESANITSGLPSAAVSTPTPIPLHDPDPNHSNNHDQQLTALARLAAFPFHHPARLRLNIYIHPHMSATDTTQLNRNVDFFVSLLVPDDSLYTYSNTLTESACTNTQHNLSDDAIQGVHNTQPRLKVLEICLGAPSSADWGSIDRALVENVLKPVDTLWLGGGVGHVDIKLELERDEEEEEEEEEERVSPLAMKGETAEDTRSTPEG